MTEKIELLPCPFCQTKVQWTSKKHQHIYHHDNGCALSYFSFTPIEWKKRATPTGVESVTVEQLSRDIQTWRFDDSQTDTFGSYLMAKYPHGIKIVP